MTVPASYEKLINDVEHELRNVDSNTSLDHPRHPLQTAGRVITRAVEWSEEALTTDALVAQKKRIEELEAELAASKALVLNRDEIIAEKSKLINAQNGIISGLHAQRRTQVGQLNAAVITLFDAMRIESVIVTDARMRETAKRTSGAQYALTVFDDRFRQQTRFEITKTGDEQ